MNNLLSYCGLIDAKIRAFDKDLPVCGYVGTWVESWLLLMFKFFSFKRTSLAIDTEEFR